MKVPSLDKTESVLLIGVVVALGYVLYRAYGVAGDAKASVTKLVGNIGDAITGAVDSAKVYGAALGTRTDALLSGGAMPATPADDQSAAETARLQRGEDAATPPSGSGYDVMGNQTGPLALGEVVYPAGAYVAQPVTASLASPDALA